MNDNELLDIYSDYLISAFDLTTATGLAGLLGGAVSHDRLQRVLARRELTSADLWRLVKPHVRAVQQDGGVLIAHDHVAIRLHTAADRHMARGLARIFDSVLGHQPRLSTRGWIPAQAGMTMPLARCKDLMTLDSRLRGNDTRLAAEQLQRNRAEARNRRAQLDGGFDTLA